MQIDETAIKDAEILLETDGVALVCGRVPAKPARTAFALAVCLDGETTLFARGSVGSDRRRSVALDRYLRLRELLAERRRGGWLLTAENDAVHLRSTPEVRPSFSLAPSLDSDCLLTDLRIRCWLLQRLSATSPARGFDADAHAAFVTAAKATSRQLAERTALLAAMDEHPDLSVDELLARVEAEIGPRTALDHLARERRPR